MGCCNAKQCWNPSPNSGGTVVDQEKIPDLLIFFLKKNFSNTPAPASWLCSKHMISSCFSWPNSFGSEPVSWFSPSQSPSKAPSCESSWPLQIQVSITSINLLHPWFPSANPKPAKQQSWHKKPLRVLWNLPCQLVVSKVQLLQMLQLA